MEITGLSNNVVLEDLNPFFNLALDLLCIADNQGTFIKLNPQWEITLGFSLSELEGKKFISLVHPDDVDKTIETMGELWEGRPVHNFINRFRCSDGSYKYIEWRSYPHKNLIYASARDVTQRKQFEERLSELIDFNNRIIEASPIGIATYDSSGQCKIANRALADIVGSSLYELLIQNFNKLDSWRESGLLDLANEALKLRQEVNKEVLLKTNLGKNVWLDCHLSHFYQLNEPHLILMAVDISDKKETEFILKESEDKLKRMLEYSPIAISISDKNGTIKYCNKLFIDTFGYSIDEIKEGEQWFNKAYPDSSYRNIIIQKWNNYVRGAEQGNIIPTDEYLITCKEGDLKTIEISGAKIGDEYFNIYSDVTEKRKAEKLLRESERRFRETLIQLDLISVVIDRTGTIEFINDYALKLLGYTFNEVSGKNWFDLFISNIDTVNEIRNYFATAKVPGHLEYLLKTKDGSQRSIRWSNTMLRNTEGEFTGTASIGEDITERKELESILDFRYRLIELANQSDMDAVIQFTLDTAEIMTRSKIGFFHYMGDDQNTLNLQTWSTNTLKHMCNAEGKGLHYSIDKAGVWVDCVKQKKAVIHNDYESLAHKKGLPEGHAPIKRELVVPIIRDNKIKALIGIGNKPDNYTQHDIETVTILADAAWNIFFSKQTESALRESESRLRELNSTKDKFFSIIAHDLKSPFQGLIGYSNMLVNEYDDLTNEERKQFINGIYDLSNSTFKLLDNLLEWSRIQKNNKDYFPQPTNLYTESAITLSLLSETARTKNIILDNRIDEEDIVFADRNMLQTVLRNLVSNSIKFSHSNSKIIISSRKVENEIEITIKDFGVGISKENLDNLFRIDTQVSTKGTQNEIGTGLGLILCKEMIELNGGKIWAESEIYKGSRFYFTLPVGEKTT